MPRKKLPQNNAGYEGRWVGRDEKDKIQNAIDIFGQNGFALSDEMKDNLSEAVRNYFFDVIRMESHPTLTEVRNRLKGIRMHSEKLADALDKIDKRSYDILRFHDKKNEDIVKSGFEFDHEYREMTVEIARNWEFRADFALHFLKGKRDTRKPNYPQITLIRKIIEAYGSAGQTPGLSRTSGANDPSGPLFGIIKSFLTTIDVPIHSDESLYQLIRKGLKIHDKMKQFRKEKNK